MFLSNLKEAQAFLSKYLPNTGTYYSSKRNYSYDFENKIHSTSLLSPYIRYRLLSEEDIIKKVLAIHPFAKVEKFIQEIFWRTYWKGWLEHREEVYEDYLSEKNFLLQEYVSNTEYKKVINAETEIDFFNNWVTDLKNNGYLHNHVRMWFASLWIFTFNLPWQLGANFFMENLLDGDPASNTLSWRWVAGIQTKGKHYLARKDNIVKFSNIKINNKIFINENAISKVEEKNYEINEINLSNQNHLNSEAILIPSDELNFIQNNNYKFKYIFSGVPIDEYNDHNFSKNVIRHLKKIITSNFQDNKFYKNISYEIHFDDYHKNFKKWIKRYNIQNVCIPYVTKGNWRTITKKIINDNPSINFIYLKRNYDREAWKYSKKGFFHFKKHIPELITKINNERNFKN